MQASSRSNFVLICVAALWGASYPVGRAALRDVAPSVFLLARFASAALLLAPWAWRQRRHGPSAALGLKLGLIEGAVCALLAANITAVSSARCAFIMGSSVVMVPLWAALFGLQRLGLFQGLRAAISLAGLYCLTGASLSALHRPELAILAAACLWALNIALLKRETSRHHVLPNVVAFYQTLSNCLVPVALLLRAPQRLGGWTPTALCGLAFCAIFATALGLVLQTRHQKHTTAGQASLRLSLEPLFASLVAVAFFGEHLTPLMAGGAGLMVVATFLPQLRAVVWS